VDDFIEMGADALDPIPPYVKDSDPADMKKTYGSRLCLHGGVNHIDVMVYGSPQKVREEVKLRMEQMKPDGAYICGASQVLTDQMPLENIIALFNSVREFGAY
jgi:uroporphyrinogen decarboxylase